MENRLDERNDMAVSPCPLAFTALCQIMKIWREKVDRPIISKGTLPVVCLFALFERVL